jgi:hypothetical protein
MIDNRKFVAWAEAQLKKNIMPYQAEVNYQNAIRTVSNPKQFDDMSLWVWIKTGISSFNTETDKWEKLLLEEYKKHKLEDLDKLELVYRAKPFYLVDKDGNKYLTFHYNAENKDYLFKKYDITDAHSVKEPGCMEFLCFYKDQWEVGTYNDVFREFTSERIEEMEHYELHIKNNPTHSLKDIIRLNYD